MQCGGEAFCGSRARHTHPDGAERCGTSSGSADGRCAWDAIHAGTGGYVSQRYGPAETSHQHPARSEVEGMQSSGVNESFEQCVTQHHREMYLYIWRLTRGSSDTEDLFQDTFLRA